MNKRELIAEVMPEALMLDDEFDDCIIGMAIVNGDDVVVYDKDKVIAELGKTMGEGALEFYESNMAGARGKNMMVFVSVIEVE